MDKFSNTIIRRKKTVLSVFIITAVICAFCMLFVSTNYNMADYLPKDAQSTQAINILKDEFAENLPNARVMIGGVTLNQALSYKEKLTSIDGVLSVTWLDDIIGASELKTIPFEYLNSETVEEYYKNDTALFSLSIKSGDEKAVVSAVRDLIGPQNSIAGDAVNSAELQEMTVAEVVKALLMLLPIVLIILLISTTSWIEPLLFLICIGIAVLINMGTNVFFGEVSFITKSVSPVLQLAVSLDYAIFLLHSFASYKGRYSPAIAMRQAMKKTLPAIAASAATTVIGFMALMFMRFGIGSDLGINLVKGVVLSFISVMTLLPALTLSCSVLIEKTHHRKFLPEMNKAALKIMKISKIFLLLAAIIIIPCFLAQRNIDFMYGMSDIARSTKGGSDAVKIERLFGKQNTLVLLLPKGDTGKEVLLCDKLSKNKDVTSVISYTSAVGAQIPYEFVPKEAAEQFYSDSYTRIILYTSLPEEGEKAFSAVEQIINTADEYYDNCYLAGQSATLYDMKNVVSSDNNVINLIAILGIFIVLLATFRSLSIPLILIFTIETAIWVNLSIAYFTSADSFNFIGYLIISTVQLGSTVDYAILLTDKYLAARKKHEKKEAIQKAYANNVPAILISASILSAAGFILMLTSTNSIISQLGALLGRGTLLSLFMVACVLPALLVVFDKFIKKTTLKNGFYEATPGSENNKIL